MSETARQPSPPLVALASWILPGAGYFLLGQKKRGLTIGITIISLFLMGLLIGGVRVLEVPGFNEFGEKIMVYPAGSRNSGPAVWIIKANALAEIRSKPWSIAQILNGPLALASAAWSVQAATDPDGRGPLEPAGALSHARVNELGVLYTAVAGMLNLLAMIDASNRAGEPAAKNAEAA